MTLCQISQTYQRGIVIVLARIEGEDGNPLLQADIDTITLKVTDEYGDTAAPIYTESIDPADVIFDTLQVGDPRWKLDEIGFNFLHQVDGDATRIFSRTLRFEYEMVPVSSPNSRIWVVVRVEVLDAYAILEAET